MNINPSARDAYWALKNASTELSEACRLVVEGLPEDQQEPVRATFGRIFIKIQTDLMECVAKLDDGIEAYEENEPEIDRIANNVHQAMFYLNRVKDGLNP